MLHNATVSDLPFEFWDPNISPSYRWILRVQTVLEPVIIALGILGNSLATHVFMSKRLRTTSCCLYLAAKCLGDTIFLIALFIVWLHRVHAPLLNTTGICQMTIFITYSCSFSSVWLIVLVSHENYVRIALPHLVKTYCTPRRALVSILVVFLSAVVIYHFHLWTTRVLEDDNSELLCMALASGISKTNKRPVPYPNIPSAIRPMPHREGLPVPVPPDSYTLNDEEDKASVHPSAVKASTPRDPDFVPIEESAQPHKITQNELHDLVRGLVLPKNTAEL